MKTLAVRVGLDVRTLERRFREQFHTTPKVWIMRERMSFAPSLLAEGLSNKQIAASLDYTCESNFCRDFKRCFGCTPRDFARRREPSPRVSCFDKELSCFDKRPELHSRSASGTLGSAMVRNPDKLVGVRPPPVRDPGPAEIVRTRVT